MKEFQEGQAILLNGTSSSGKTTLAKVLQQKLKEPYLNVSLDQYRDSLPDKYRGLNSPPGTTGYDGLNVVPIDSKGGEKISSIQFGRYGKKVLHGMRLSSAGLVRHGLNIIIDDILLEASFLDDYLKTFCDLKLYFIGLFCPLEAVEKREASRIGRFPGTAQSQLEVCHAHGVYDLSLDTSILSPEDCAEKIIDRLASGAPEAFKTLRA
jgi:chloramphenicol 3-O phosphotransferase